MATIPMSCTDHLSAGLTKLLEAINNITVDMGELLSIHPPIQNIKESTP